MHSGDGPVHTPSKRRSFITPQSLFNLRQFYLKRAKLKTAGRVSALLSGFALVAIIELDVSCFHNILIKCRLPKQDTRRHQHLLRSSPRYHAYLWLF
ncbi:hypothetical protein CLF_107415 [Clonorchis sinensis]|uniref:Uncharacterized protein n=1 Tax=Clonorchis sinensis TaxID=79923 RepID=G7YGR7_CLOSI|nr:hypothetical protein CLF_107415 [Clonorchis sinensis]